MSTMISNRKNDKIFDFGDSQSESEIQQTSHLKNHSRISANMNPQKQTHKNNLKNFQTSTKNYHTVKDEKSSINVHLRRNRSFKVKKHNQKLDVSKQIYNKSVAKFTNIFQQAEQISFNSSNILAVHEQSRKEKNQPMQESVRSVFKKQQPIVIKSIQNQSILKLSNITQKNLIIEEKDFKNKMMRTTAFTQKPMKEYLEKKLNTKLAVNRPVESQNDKKIKLRVEQITDMDSFVHKKIQKNLVLEARLKKNTSGFNFLWPEYQLNDLKSNIHILSGKKKSANTTSNYYISRNQKQIDVQNQHYMGKVRSNFLGSCFNIFNQGVNPESGVKGQDKIRKLLATVIYESQIANANPKTVKVYMIKPPYSYYELQGTNIKDEEASLEELYQIGQNKHKIFLFNNRKPNYNKKQNKFVLSFGGRIKKPSTKNFILEDHETKKQVMMFGKLDEDEYVTYISSPLTPHIGMGIALAELDNKIICD